MVGLNKAQKEAVTHRTGPLLIIAGAGTGKTTVITRRIAWLIEQKLAEPSEILALTFTEKAAAEMEERVDRLVPYGFTDMWISTFHAFGDRLLRDYAIELGLPANFKVLTATEQAIFMRQNIYAFDLNYYRPVANPISHIQALLYHFSRLKDELISPEEYLALAQSQNSNLKSQSNDQEKILELARTYSRYQELMVQAGNLDFGDQLFLTYKLLKENLKVLAECQNKYKYILVDEFQDTNFAQNEMVKLLASKHQNITVVGDDDQSIYRFRGASISNILDFKKTYKSAEQIVLNLNYRSTQQILDSSYKLIQNNNPDRLEVKNKIDKRLLSDKNGLSPELLHCDTLSCEADLVVKKITELKAKMELNYNDFAILVRANTHAEPFIQSLNIAGIPHIFSGASDLFSYPEIKMLVAFLKCLVYTDDNLAFYQLATSELYRIPDKEISGYYTQAVRSNRSITEVIETEFGDKKVFIELLADIGNFRQRKNEPVGELLYQYLSEKKYLSSLTENPTIDDELKVSRIAKFFDRISEFNHSSEERGVLAFLHNLELILEVGDEVIVSDIDPDLDAVNILTAHASKGLEWPVVFIVNCVSDRFPGRKKKEALPIPDDLIRERLPEGDFHLQEERRLFYVAATRAKDLLFLTSADDYGGKRAKKLSQFVMELLDKPKSDEVKHKSSPMEKIARFGKLSKKPLKLPDKFSGEVIKLSRQQIDDYFSCPKKFYFAHIVKIPLLENHYLMYGTAIHAALDHFFRRRLKGEKPKIEQLQQDFLQAFKSVGFITREHEDQRRRNGLLALERFFQSDIIGLQVPARVEEPFEFYENKIKVSGRYDLIYDNKDGIEIRDFKTSDVREQTDADKRIKKSTQMMIYALAWYEKHQVIPKTSLYFIESGIKAETVFTPNVLTETKEMIFRVAAGIKKMDFAAEPDYNTCRGCPYRDICYEAI